MSRSFFIYTLGIMLSNIRIILCVLSVFAVSLAAGASEKPSASTQQATLRVAMSTLHEETFLPWIGGGGRKFYLDTIYEYLAYFDPDTHELLPGLAINWHVSDDGMLWTLNIRRGIQFHKGWGELTAEDVVYSLERLLDPSAVSGPSSSMRAVVEHVRQTSSYQLQIQLKTPDIAFVQGYLSNAMQAMIVSKRYVTEVGDEEANAKPIGTGAFELESLHSGVSIIVKSISESKPHWRVQPDFQRIAFYAVPEESTRVAMLRTGEADLAPVNFDSIKSLKRHGLNIVSIKNSWSPIVRLGGLVSNNDKYFNGKVPWQDKRVRQALNYAVDKQAILDAIFHGEGRIAGTDFPAQEFFPIKPYPYDPAKAKALMKDAGFEKGFSVTLKTFTTSPGAELPIIGEIIAMYWREIGIDVRIVPIDWISLRGAQINGKTTGFVWTHRGIAFPNPLVGLQASYTSESVFSTFSNDNVEEMLSGISNALDPEVRSQRIREFGEMIHDEATGVFLIFSNEPYGATQKIGRWPSLSQHVTNMDLITKSTNTDQGQK
ncbi:ABC transporter substrate-binding protein [Aurantivibrio plasticivorans]